MSTVYHYCLFEAEFGPVGFRELVRLVQQGMLGADDLVKADWEQEWHPAAEVVGLFHTAGRADVLKEWEAAAGVTDDDSSGDQAVDDIVRLVEVVKESNVPLWQRRWMEVQERRKSHEVEESRERFREFDEAETRQRVQSAISAAEAALDQRQLGLRLGWIQQWKNSIFSPNSLHSIFRLGLTVFAANLIAFSILAWSKAEVQRHPKRGNVPALQQHVFPFFGTCSSGEYLFLLADAMIMAGVGGYGAARVLESMADD